MHLGDYLIKHKLASNAQVREALDYCQSHGGCPEDHLFRWGYVSETALVEAMEAVYDCPGVCLSDRSIPESITGLIPAQVARDYLLLPFALDEENSVVKIACSYPVEEIQTETVASILPDYTAQFHVSLGMTLRSAILRHYRAAQDTDEGLSSVPPIETASEQTLEDSSEEQMGDDAGDEGTEQECRLLLLDMIQGQVPALGQLLQYQRYLVAVTATSEAFVETAGQYRPHIRLVQAPKDRSALNQLLQRLDQSGIELALHPTYLIVEDPEKHEISHWLRLGFEDVIDSDNVLDLMMIKLHQARSRIVREQRRRREYIRHLGTHGSLAQMSIIDLVQALGPTTKTARLSVTGEGLQLTAFINQGQFHFAECDNHHGAEAIYCALAWERGVWSIDPVDPDELPVPNIEESNDAILLEGCRRLDEGRDTGPSLPVDDLLASLDRDN